MNAEAYTVVPSLLSLVAIAQMPWLPSSSSSYPSPKQALYVQYNYHGEKRTSLAALERCSINGQRSTRCWTLGPCAGKPRSRPRLEKNLAPPPPPPVSSTEKEDPGRPESAGQVVNAPPSRDLACRPHIAGSPHLPFAQSAQLPNSSDQLASSSSSSTFCQISCRRLCTLPATTYHAQGVNREAPRGRPHR